MKEKLIKKDGQFYCLDEKTVIIGTTDEELLKHKPLVTKKLSLKNCEAIAIGLDIELFSAHYGASKVKSGKSVDYGLGASEGFEEGFQKAIEILGDKKFSEEDMKRLLSIIVNNAINVNNTDMAYNYIKSLQQTEWDVQIEMNSFFKNDYDGKIVDTNPKLDEDGCLILKRI